MKGKPEGKRALQRPKIDGRMILKWIIKKWDGGIDRIDLSKNRNGWRTFVSRVMKLWFL